MRRAALAVFLSSFCLYFLRFTADGLNSFFSNDDLMNLHYYWMRSWPETIRDNLLFFIDAPRPMGGLYYKAIYAIWGFQPFPYRAGAFVLIALNLALLFLIVRLLANSTEAGALALLLTGLNETFVSLYYDTGMIYDVLAFFFSYAAFYYYLRIRQSGKLLNIGQTAIVLGLFVAALKSKEIAVSLPVAILLYELLWNPPRKFWMWLKGPARIALLSGMAAAADLVGKARGAASLLKQGPYHPTPSAALYFKTYLFYWKPFTLDLSRPSASGILGILVAVLVISCLSRQRHLVFAAVMANVSFLPLAFIAGRNGFAFYVPSLYWSLWFAGALVDARKLLVRWLPARFEFATQVVLCLGLAGVVAPRNAKQFSYVLPIVHDSQDQNRRSDQQIHECLPQIPHGSEILMLDDPYPAEMYDLHFLVGESYNDPTLTVFRSKNLRLFGVEPDPKKYKIVLNYSEGRFHLMP